MTLISIFDLIDNDPYFRTELREKIEEVYPGIFDFSKTYFIKIEDWDKDFNNYRILPSILALFKYDNFDLKVYRRVLNSGSGILIGPGQVLLLGVGSFSDPLYHQLKDLKRASVFDIDECSIKNFNWIEIDVDEFISKIMEFANTLYITRRKVVFGLNY